MATNFAEIEPRILAQAIKEWEAMTPEQLHAIDNDPSHDDDPLFKFFQMYGDIIDRRHRRHKRGSKK